MPAPSARIRSPVWTDCCVDETGTTTCYHYNWIAGGLPHKTSERPHPGARPRQKAHRTGIERSPGDHRPGPADVPADQYSRGSHGLGGAHREARGDVTPDGP